MKHLGLFEGIGGFSLAARWMGWQTVAWCEWNEFGQQVLRHHFPEAEGHGDITKTDFTKYANTIDILTGGFPCQPYSTAGKRKGKEDERHLWPEMLRAIREVRPRWVVGENVFGLVNWSGGLVFHEVQADLEAEGYEVWPYVLPACAKDAPHRRDRVWFVAHSRNHVHQVGLEFGRDQYKTGGSESENEQQGRRNKNGQRLWVESGTGSEDVTYTDGSGFQRSENQEEGQFTINRNAWDFFPTESAICPGNDGFSELLDTTTISEKDWREESIKAAGNAIVPQVAYEIFKAIEQYENRGDGGDRLFR